MSTISQLKKKTQKYAEKNLEILQNTQGDYY